MLQTVPVAHLLKPNITELTESGPAGPARDGRGDAPPPAAVSTRSGPDEVPLEMAGDGWRDMGGDGWR